MTSRRFPTPAAWKRHTRQAAAHGLSSAALATLGTEPRARADPASFTGFVGVVTCLNRDEAVCAGVLASQAVGRGRGVQARRAISGFWLLTVPISRRAAAELKLPKRIPHIPNAGPTRTAAYNALMRPTARARIRARAILAED